MYSELRRGFYASLPLMLGLLPLAMILGAQASQQGQSFITAYLMAAINYAGGSEFAAVGLWQTIMPPMLIIWLSTFLINSRHIILGTTLAPYIQKESGMRIFFIYFVMCDETWALSMQDIQRRQKFSYGYHMGVGLSIWLVWSWGTFLGAFIGTNLGDLSQYGFVMALPATFIGLAVAMRPKQDIKKYIPIACSFIASSLCAVYFDQTYSVGIGALIGLISAYILEIYKEKNHA